MRTSHVQWLACARCRGPLRLAGDPPESDGHVMSGSVTCDSCAAAYPVRNGIPRFAPPAMDADVRRTVEAFGYEWERSDEILSKSRFNDPETFLGFIDPVRPEWFRGKTVLDGGCGGGRWLVAAAEFGAALVAGVDLSSSVDVAFTKTRRLGNVLVVQGDVLNLPLRRAFDYAFSVGVLHHTRNPRAAFLEIASTVGPGGSVSAWVYGAEHNEWVHKLVTPLRRVTSRLPRSVLLVMAHAAAIPLTMAVKLVYGPLSRSPTVAPLARRLFYADYLVFLDQFGYREHAYIVFDHAAPAIAEYIPRDTLNEWFLAAGLTHVTISSRAANSWRGFGLVPSGLTSDTLEPTGRDRHIGPL